MPLTIMYALAGTIAASLTVIMAVKFYQGGLRIPAIPRPGNLAGPGLLLNAIKLVGATLILQIVFVLLFGWSTLWLFIIYGPLMVLLAIGATEPNADVKKAIGVLALVGFIAAGWYGVERWWSPPCDQSCQLQKQKAAAAAAKLETERQLAIEKVRYPGCDRQKKPVTFSPKWVRINPDGSCAPDLYYVKQEVTLWAKQAGNDKPIGPIHWGEALPLDTEWIMSEDKTFNGFVQLSPPRYTQLFR